MEKTVEQPIIADTSALVSLAIETDQNHKVATAAAMQLRTASRPIIFPTAVLVETVNILGKRSGHETALQTADGLLRPGSQFVLVETTPHLEAALKRFRGQGAAVSLTDCIVMTLADHYRTKDIFGFDKQFVDAGYTRLTPSPDWKNAA